MALARSASGPGGLSINTGAANLLYALHPPRRRSRDVPATQANSINPLRTEAVIQVRPQQNQRSRHHPSSVPRRPRNPRLKRAGSSARNQPRHPNLSRPRAFLARRQRNHSNPADSLERNSRRRRNSSSLSSRRAACSAQHRRANRSRQAAFSVLLRRSNLPRLVDFLAHQRSSSRSRALVVFLEPPQCNPRGRFRSYGSTGHKPSRWEEGSLVVRGRRSAPPCWSPDPKLAIITVS